MISPHSNDDSRFSWKKLEQDNHQYFLEAVDLQRRVAYFHDVYQEFEPCVVAMDLTTGALSLHKYLRHHNYFERELAFAEGGTIVAISGMGVELFADDGDPHAAPPLRKGHEARVVAADRSSYVFAPAYGLEAIERWRHSGDLVWSVDAVRLDGEVRRFGWDAPNRFGVSSLWLDVGGNTWVAGEHGVMALGPTGEVVGHLPRSLFDPAADIERLVGVDRQGVAWFGAGPAYWGYWLGDLTGEWLSPAIDRQEARTGLEPELGDTSGAKAPRA